MSNDKDFKVKNGIQPTVYQEGLGTVATGSVTVGYADASTWSYDSVSFSLTGQGTSPSAIFVKPDGTKFYTIDDAANEVVYQYSMTTAWDLSTATYDNKSINISAQEDTPQSIFFKPDGTKMYVLGQEPGEYVFQYTLSTAWDVSTASYDNERKSLTAQGSTPSGMYFKGDGLSLYTVEKQNDSAYQYSMTTAWDISTISYSGKSISISSEDINPEDIFFKPDGLKFYVIGFTSDSVHQYTLSTAWDISTASYDSVAFSVSSEDGAMYGMFFKPDGTKMYTSGANTDSVYQYTTGSTLTTNTLDLSTGNAFEITPTSNIQVGLSNPAASGTVSQATLLLEAEDPTGVSSAFSTTLYAGDSSERDITNGIDLAGEGGLVWTKLRGPNTATRHVWIDTERGVEKYLESNATNAEATQSISLTSFNSDGYSINNWGSMNAIGQDYVSWAFKKQSSFFDVVTYTGNNTARTISHNLGTAPGLIICKCTSGSSNWKVWHRSSANGASGVMNLNLTGADTSNTTVWNNTLPTDSVFSLGTSSQANENGFEYVAYLFAHDTSATSAIKCGSYTGNGSTPIDVEVGFEPQWVLVKNASRNNDPHTSWFIVDNVRGEDSATGGDAHLKPNKTDAETVETFLFFYDTGFQVKDGGYDLNFSGDTYIYMAIRNPSASTITYDSSIQFGGGTAPDSPAIGETDVLTFSTRDGGTTYQAAQAIDGAK